MRWDDRAVLVTGGGGFIGSHLVESLVRRGASVRVLLKYNSRNDQGLLAALPDDVRSEVEPCPGDLRDAYSVRRAVRDRDTVFHLAALIGIPYSYVNPLDYVLCNVLGTTHVLDACRDLDVSRLVHTSTSETYGSALRVPIDESHPLQPQSPYSASKIAADSMALSYHHAFALPVSVVRPFNTYGPRQSLRAVIPTVIAQALAGDHVELGHLDTTRDFLFVSDTVEGFVRMAECDAAVGRVLNLGTGSEISIRDLVAEVGRQLGRDLRISTAAHRERPEASEVERLCADASEARRVLDWAPRVTIEQGVATTIDWMRGARPTTDAHEYVV